MHFALLVYCVVKQRGVIIANNTASKNSRGVALNGTVIINGTVAKNGTGNKVKHKRMSKSQLIRSLCWDKDDSQKVRRQYALSSRRGSPIATAKALMALSNAYNGGCGDNEVARKARSDALYFFRIHINKKGGK